MNKNLKYIALSILSVSVMASLASAQNKKAPASAAPKVCPAEKGTELPLMANKIFEIESYAPETKSYTAFAVEFPDESTLNITLEALAEAIPKVKKNFDLILKNPQDIVGEKFKSAKPLPNLTDEELEARRGCIRK